VGPKVSLDICGEEENLVNLLKEKIEIKNKKSLASSGNWTLDYPPHTLVSISAMLSWLWVNIWINTHQ
jgi:hypothetical protein